jgi:hypothetical protein
MAYAVCEAYKGRGEVQMVPLAEVPQQDPLDMYQPPEGVETKGD